MCVFLSLRMNKAQIKKQFDMHDLDDVLFGDAFVKSAYSYPSWPVIDQSDPLKIVTRQWGLIPHWVSSEEKANTIRKGTVNARIETVQEKPSFRTAVRKSRCLILANGFFEFREINKTKYPYYIQLKDQAVFAVAGVGDEWLNPTTGELIKTFSLLTTVPNPLMQKIHNRKQRMPVILSKVDQARWLDVDQPVASFAKPYPNEAMEAWTVSKRLMSRLAESNVAESINEFVYPELNLYDDLMN